MKQTIDTYKLTSMEEPSDEILSQIMREAAEDARKSNEEATERYFNQMLIEAQKVSCVMNPIIHVTMFLVPCHPTANVAL